MNIDAYVREIRKMSVDGVAPTTAQWDQMRPEGFLSATSIVTKTGMRWRTFIRERCRLSLRKPGPKRRTKSKHPVCECGRRATHFERITVGTENLSVSVTDTHGVTEILELCDQCHAEFMELESICAPRPEFGAHNRWSH
jgi:hypothetical protein